MIETGSRPALAPRTARALLVGIFLIAAVLRVSALSKPYYIDEISTLTVASQSIPINRPSRSAYPVMR